MATSKREQYAKQLEKQSEEASKELRKQGNIVKETASTEPKSVAKSTVVKSSRGKQEKREAELQDTQTIQEKKAPGRPKQEDKTHVSIYVPDRILGGLQALYKLSSCKSLNEYITDLIEKDVEKNKDKIERFNKLLS